MTCTEIPYGPTHAAEMDALLGDRRNIDNVCYLQPARAGYSCADGRYAMVVTTQYGCSSRVFVFGSGAEYRAAWSGSLAAMTDPETGRVA